MADEMRGLTVRPPWSHLIARCGKSIENRSWPTRYRGLVAVHAGTRWDAAAERDPVALKAWLDWSVTLPRPNITGPLRRSAIDVDLGAVVAVAELAGCHYPAGFLCCEWARPDSWHWQLTGVRPLRDPVPCRGALGLWRLPEDVEAAVRAQLEDG